MNGHSQVICIKAFFLLFPEWGCLGNVKLQNLFQIGKRVGQRKTEQQVGRKGIVGIFLETCFHC